MNRKSGYFLRVWAPAFLWMFLVFGLSSIPGPCLPDFRIPYVHTIAHLIEYSIMGVLLARALTRICKKDLLRSSWISLVVALFFAATDEWHQSFVPGRHGDLFTVFWDSVFALLGICLYNNVVFLWFRKKRNKKRSLRDRRNG